MFSDPQFWVAVSFFLFIAAIFNPVRKLLASSLDSQIKEIKNKINEAENLKNEAQQTLSELKLREAEVENEINNLKLDSDNKISELKNTSSQKLSQQMEKRKILAEEKINQIVRDTNFAIKVHITNASIEASKSILKNNLTDKNKKDLIDSSISQLKEVIRN